MSWLMGFYCGELSVDFFGLWCRAVMVFMVVVLIGLIFFGIRGLNLGLDFEGGIFYEVWVFGVEVVDV